VAQADLPFGDLEGGSIASSERMIDYALDRRGRLDR
jgi:hypothetical protein